MKSGDICAGAEMTDEVPKIIFKEPGLQRLRLEERWVLDVLGF